MKTTTLILMTAIAVGLNHSVFAESVGNVMPLPPPGPYKSVAESDQYSPGQNIQNNPPLRENYGYPMAQSNQPNREVPEWVRQRQAQMEQWMRQSNMRPTQSWNNQPPPSNYNQAPAMPNMYSGRAPIAQDNRQQQSFPSARGPVYGPGAAPSEFYQQPVYQGPRY
jgi:hypothetical protein